MKEIKIGASCNMELTVTQEMLAKHVGSGDVAVYATPMMIALMEQVSAACLQAFLEEGETSVGTSIQTTHIAATPESMKVRAFSTITAVDGRKVTFQVQASDEQDVIGEAVHERFVVPKEKFEQRAAAKLLK